MFTRILILLVCAISVSGCSLIYSTTGDFIYDYSESYALPYSLGTQDIEMNCNLAKTSVPLLMSFSSIKTPPHKQMIAMFMMTGACSEAAARELELDYFRALKQQNPALAKDARIRAKRVYAVAASRQYSGYQHLVKAFGEIPEQCPDLDEDDEFFWFTGMLSAMQAVMSDMRAQGVVGVPQNLPIQAVRGLQCLDNEKWWGIPNAMQASVGIIFKGDKSAEYYWSQLKQASAFGAQKGVRLASAIEVITADSVGDNVRLRQAIKRYAGSLEKGVVADDYKMMDLVAKQQILAVSDRLWTQATGHRTPINGLGSFWDDNKQLESDLSLDDLLQN